MLVGDMGPLPKICMNCGDLQIHLTSQLLLIELVVEPTSSKILVELDHLPNSWVKRKNKMCFFSISNYWNVTMSIK